MSLIKVGVGGFLNRVFLTPGGIWVPGFDEVMNRKDNVLAVLRSRRGKLLLSTHNLITDAGDLYYAQRGVAATPTNAFGIHELHSAGIPAKDADRSDFTPIASTQKAHTSTYPKVGDADSDNTGAGADIITYLASYAKADFNHAAVTHGIITNVAAGATEPILTGYAFSAAFEKTADDTLKVFVNHQPTGV